MTLSTLVGFEEHTDPLEFHVWCITNLLNAPDAKFDVIGENGKALTDTYRYGHNTIMNEPSQGLDAWLITHHNNGAVIDWGEPEDEEMAEYYKEINRPTLSVYADFDTAYGFHGLDRTTGRIIGCTDLHRGYIARIIDEYAAPRGLTVWWQNEYTGEWHKDIEGLVDFR